MSPPTLSWQVIPRSCCVVSNKQGRKMSDYSNIPFGDLVTRHVELEQELTAVFQKALRTAGFIGGLMVEEFEKAFAKFCDTKCAIGVSNGTDALRFALMACGIQQ